MKIKKAIVQLSVVPLFLLVFIVFFVVDLGAFRSYFCASPIRSHVKTQSPPFRCQQEPCHISIVFMGDSLTRFMYYSLAYFLRHNEWIDPAAYPNLVKPADFLGGYELNFDWTPWYNASMAALAPYENCDCYREPGSIMRFPGKNWVVENRYFYDPIRNNTVVYFQAFGNAIEIRGHWDDPQKAMRAQQLVNRSADFSSADNNYTAVGPLVGRHPYAWSYDWATAIRQQVAKIKPNALVINAGVWAHDFDKPDFVESVMAAINETGIPRAIWKTTAAARNGQVPSQETDVALCHHEFFQQSDCLNISGWTSKLNGDFYIDRAHFREPVYRKMNEQLLEHLGKSRRLRLLNWTDLNITGDP